MSGKDSFAEIERLKRDMNGVQNDLNNVLGNRMSSNSSSMPQSYQIPSSSQNYFSSPSTGYISSNPQPSSSYRPSSTYNGLPVSSGQPIYTPTVLSGIPITITSGQNRAAAPVGPPTSSRIISGSPIPFSQPYQGSSQRVISNTQMPQVRTISSNSGGYSQLNPTSPEVIFTTIEDYLANRSSLSSEANKQRIGKLLLPADVQLLHAEKNEVLRDFLENLNKDKKALEKDLDDFLKSVIETMDKVKEVLFQRIDNYAMGFDNYYAQFINRVDDFLNESISLIQK
jgi:ElaB/YqjD/DUF883 family membrane-anchored ribosome-binding protein